MTPLLENALEQLNQRVNVSTGGGHPLDVSVKKLILKWLYEQGEELSSSEINTWAKENGWSEKNAKELGELAERIGSGGRVQIEYKDRLTENFFADLLSKSKSDES
ncbi:DUF1889 family protein [Acinetobacter sp. TY2]|uniref:DUF1889 family protein n=1 Tax=Acinetobacter sp. TY2 TaxID=3387403 RepID=UPI003917B1BD